MTIESFPSGAADGSLDISHHQQRGQRPSPRVIHAHSGRDVYIETRFTGHGVVFKDVVKGAFVILGLSSA